MGTKNSGISAKLSLDSAPWEKGLLAAEKHFKDFKGKIVNQQGIKLNQGGFGLGLGGGTSTGNTSTERARLEKMPEAARAMAKITVAQVEGNKQLANSVRVVGAGMNETTTHSRRFGMTLLNLGYIADDAAYGLRGVINNIGPLVMGMGLGAGVAGAIQVLAVGLREGMVYWDEWTGATARAKKAAKETADAQEDAAKRMVRAQERGAAEADSTSKSAEGARDYWDERNSGNVRADRLRNLRREADGVVVESSSRRERPGVESARGDLERVRKQNELDRRTEKASFVERARATAEEFRDNARRLEQLKIEIPAKQTVLDALKGQEKARTTRIKDVTDTIEKNEASGNMQRRIENHRLRRYRSSQEAASEEQAQLEPALAALREEEASLQSSQKGASEKIADLNQEGGPEAAERERIRVEKEAAAQAKLTNAALDLTGEAFKRVGTALGDMVKLGVNAAQMAHERNEKDKANTRIQRDLGISEIRSPSRRKRLERAAGLADETQRLIDGGMDAGQAADMAARQQRVNDRAGGDRTIRGGRSENTVSGLDSFGFKQRGHAAMMADGNLPTEKEAAGARGAAALRRAKMDADRTAKSGGPGADPGKSVGEVLAVLREIAEAVQKTPAERAAPAR